MVAIISLGIGLVSMFTSTTYTILWGSQWPRALQLAQAGMYAAQYHNVTNATNYLLNGDMFITSIEMGDGYTNVVSRGHPGGAYDGNSHLTDTSVVCVLSAPYEYPFNFPSLPYSTRTLYFSGRQGAETGGQVTDQSGQANAATKFNLTYTPNRLGEAASALTFWGSYTSRLAVTQTTVSQNLYTNGTLSTWVYFDWLGPTSTPRLITKGDTLNKPAFSKYYVSYSLWVNSRHLELSLNDNNAFVTSSLTLTTGTWYFVAGTWNTNGMTVYVKDTNWTINSTNFTTNTAVASYNSGPLFFGVGSSSDAGTNAALRGRMYNIYTFNWCLNSIMVDSLAWDRVAYYPFNLNYNDETWRTNNGTNNGAITFATVYPTTNITNYSVQLPSRGYVSAPNVDYELYFIQGMPTGATVMAFFRWTNALANSQNPVFSYGAGTKYQFSIQESKTAGWYFTLLNSGGSAISVNYDPGTLTTGVWYHVAGVYNGSQMLLYLNGVQVATYAVATTIYSNQPTYTLTIGSSGNGVFRGFVNSPKVFNRALQSNEVLRSSQYQYSP